MNTPLTNAKFTMQSAMDYCCQEVLDFAKELEEKLHKAEAERDRLAVANVRLKNAVSTIARANNSEVAKKALHREQLGQ